MYVLDSPAPHTCETGALRLRLPLVREPKASAAETRRTVVGALWQYRCFFGVAGTTGEVLGCVCLAIGFESEELQAATTSSLT
eukprot:12559487-Alexandrium_andersonii.AAC.1